MKIELPIINEPDTGLCVGVDVQGNGEVSKILISTNCANNYISEELYLKMEYCDVLLPEKVRKDSTAYYLRDVDKARIGIVKLLPLPGHTLTDVKFLVTPKSPAYRCDMVLGMPVICRRYLSIDPDAGLVTISD
jgi:hypothetical protein